MKKLLAAFLLLTVTSQAYTADPVKVLMQTSAGDITLSLNAEKAPVTVENFLQYVTDGHYNGLVFHRVISGFMIQGGGYDKNYQQRTTRAPIQNEARNGLKNKRGSISMARTSAPHSASSQFFINHRDNNNLDHPSFDGWGYAVFGEVTEGMDIVDAIASTKTGAIAPFGRDVPINQVVINKVIVLEGEKTP